MLASLYLERMSKKHFVAMANMIREHNRVSVNNDSYTTFTADQICALADFCRSQNYNFKGERWVQYIAGECGPNGGAR